MSRTKEYDGVQATVERLTGIKPCPAYLRDIANKYLRSKLFPKKKDGSGDKMSTSGSDLLLYNAMFLDGAFEGSTELVTEIINRERNVESLKCALDKAQQNIERRFHIYNFWRLCFIALREILKDSSTDLTKVRLDVRLNGNPFFDSVGASTRFGLPAAHILESFEGRMESVSMTAKEYTEQADAYMGLGDYASADEKAQMAIELEPDNSRAWFIRVMVAYHQRNAALKEVQHHRLIASEVAEPMSSQESWALERADEEGRRANVHCKTLDEILPKALLHWPRHNRHHEHHDEYVVLRKLFIDQLFQSKCGPQAKIDAIFAGSDSKEPGFSDEESKLMSILTSERDKDEYFYYGNGDSIFLSRDLKLLHLRWMIKAGGYDAHWTKWSKDAYEHFPEHFERTILPDTQMSKIWQLHQQLHGGDSSVTEALTKWEANLAAQHDRRGKNLLMNQHTILFHNQFAESNYLGSFRTARLAEGLANSAGNMLLPGTLPDDDMTSAPVDSPRYWRYLQALSLIRASLTGQEFDDAKLEFLLEAPELRREIQGSVDWQWHVEEVCDGGGHAEYDIEPYELDLRDAQIWRSALEAQLTALPEPAIAEQIRSVIAALQQEGDA